MNAIEKSKFADVQVGDVIVCFKEDFHDYEQHAFKVTKVKHDKEYVTETNPKGLVAYGKDLDYKKCEECYIGVVYEDDFLKFID